MEYFGKFAIVVLLLLPLPGYANFGLGPCCSGAPCGIIPCDSACGGQAITQMGTSVSTALSALQSAYEGQTQATNNAQSNLSTLSQGLLNTLNRYQLDNLSALDAATLRIENSLATLIPAKERLSDHKINSLISALKKYFAAINVSTNVRSLGPMSQPISGDVAPNRAAYLIEMIRKSDQIEARNTQDYYTFQSNSDVSASGTNSALVEQILVELNGDQDVSRLINSSILSEEEAQSFQRLLAYIVSIRPQSTISRGSDGELLELTEKRRVATNTIIYNAIIKILAAKTASAAKDWDGIYEDPIVSTQNEISLSEALNVEVNDRLLNAEWYGSIKRLTPNGLVREVTYLSATGNMLRGMEYDYKQRASTLTALIYSAKRSANENN